MARKRVIENRYRPILTQSQVERIIRLLTPPQEFIDYEILRYLSEHINAVTPIAMSGSFALKPVNPVIALTMDEALVRFKSCTSDLNPQMLGELGEYVMNRGLQDSLTPEQQAILSAAYMTKLGM